MKNVEYVILSDIATLSVGYPFRNTCIPGDSGVLACFLRDVDLDGSLNVNCLKRVEDAKPNASHLAVADDIVFRSRGVSFVSAVVPPLGEDLLVVAPMIRIRVDSTRVLPEYLAWYINGANGAAYFKEFAKGTAMPLISKSVLEKMPIMDRKYYIDKYVEYVNMRNAAMEGGDSSTTSNISNYTSMSQGLNGDDIAEELGF